MNDYKSYLYLEFYDFDCNPDQLTALLNLKPSWTAIKGEPWQVPGRQKNTMRIYQSNFWKYKLTDKGQFQFEDLLDQLIEKLTPISEKLKETTEKHSGQLLFVSYIGDNNPGFGFSSNQLKFIADHGLSIYFDVYTVK